MPRSEQANEEVHYLLNLERWVSSDRFGDKEAANELVDFTLNSKVLNGSDSGWKMSALEHVISAVYHDPVVDRAVGAMAVVALAENEEPPRSPSETRYSITRAAKGISRVANMYYRWANQYGDNHAYDEERNRNDIRADKVASFLTPLFRTAISHFQKPVDQPNPPVYGYVSPERAVNEVISAIPADKGQQAAALEVWKDNLVAVAIDRPKSVGAMLQSMAWDWEAPKPMREFAERETKAFYSGSVGLRFLDRVTGHVFHLNRTPDTIASRADEIHYGHKSFRVADPSNDALAKWQASHPKADLPAPMDIGDTGPAAEKLQEMMKRRAQPAPIPSPGNGGS